MTHTDIVIKIAQNEQAIRYNQEAIELLKEYADLCKILQEARKRLKL